MSTYVIARAEERFATSTGLAVRHTEDGVIAEVEMRPASGQLTEIALAEIRTVAAQLSAVDDDVLDVLLANAIANGADNDDLHTVEIDAISAARISRCCWRLCLVRTYPRNLGRADVNFARIPNAEIQESV